MKSAFARSLFIMFFAIFITSCSRQIVATNVDIPSIPYHPLNAEQDLDILLQQIGNARIVLLGEASHGTAEYYDWRTAITKRLIQEKGFDLVGVEGEWADSYRVNSFIKGPAKSIADATTLLKQYDRWPTWMWGNEEVASLVTWMNQYNQGKAANDKAGFYGLDVYCLWESMTELMPYVQNSDSLRKTAQQVYQCFKPYNADPSEYAYGVANASANCRKQTENLWKAVMQQTGNTTATAEAPFVIQQNALVALNGERYYRTMISDDVESWNIRDRHMMQTIKRLLEKHGPDSKMIIWEHNTHIGDARYTDMAGQGMVNVGQLVREEYGRQNVFAVGTGSYEGTVMAGRSWGATMESMAVPPAINGSWEQILHQRSAENKLLFSNEIRNVAGLNKSIGHRAIGVVYNPASESNNYVPTIIPDRYDAFMYFEKTSALHPIPVTPRNEPPDTYPSAY